MDRQSYVAALQAADAVETCSDAIRSLAAKIGRARILTGEDQDATLRDVDMVMALGERIERVLCFGQVNDRSMLGLALLQNRTTHSLR